MLDFQFRDNNTVGFTLRTDGNSLNDGQFTIQDFIEENTTEAGIIGRNFWLGKVVTQQDLVTFSTNKTLGLVAVVRNQAQSQTVLLANPAVAAPTFSSVTSTGMTVNCPALAGQVAGYQIDRATNSGFTTGLTQTSISGTNTSAITGLTTATTYYYRIRAVLTDGSVGLNSATASQITS